MLGISVLVSVFTGTATYAANLSAYDHAVLTDRPIAYLSVSGNSRTESDLSGHGHSGTFEPSIPDHKVTLPNGEVAASFDGATESLDIASASSLSIPKTGILTVEAWIRPETLQFRHFEKEGFVYWMGKGRDNQQEYAGRMYSLHNTASPPRPNRISGYAFNLDGGFGSGSYFQDSVRKGDWIHVSIVYNTVARSHDFPTGYVRIYSASTLRDTTALEQYNIVPAYGSAPLRLGTRDGDSYFAGAVAKFAVYNYELSAASIAAHERAMLRQ